MHLTLQIVDNGICIPVKERDELRHMVCVHLGLHLAHTRSAALFNMEQKAWSTETLMLVELPLTASTNRKSAQQEIQGFANGPCVRIGTEITRTFSLRSTHHNRTGKLLIDSHCQEWITLIISQSHVETRMVLLNKRIFKNECFHLITNFDPFHGMCCLHHGSRAGMQLRWILKIVRQPLSKIRCFAYINDTPMLILELIRTWCYRNRASWWTLNRHGYFFDLAGAFAGAAFFFATVFFASTGFFALGAFGSGIPSNGAR